MNKRALCVVCCALVAVRFPRPFGGGCLSSKRLGGPPVVPLVGAVEVLAMTRPSCLLALSGP